MPFRAWLRDFLTYEAQNGGALPPQQLFPFLANLDTLTDESIDGSNESADEKAEAGGVSTAQVSNATANARGGDASFTSSSYSSSSSTPPPPPPSGPPPIAAIAPSQKRVTVRDVGCSTAAASLGSPHVLPRFYSRYVFLHTVTALQLLWGYFSFALWNYLAHIRWYGASMAYLAIAVSADVRNSSTNFIAPQGGRGGGDDVTVALHRPDHQWLAVAYLAFALAGLTYTVSAVLYVCAVNTPCHVRAAWPSPVLRVWACCPGAGLSSRSHRANEENADEDPFSTYGPVKRRARRSTDTAASRPSLDGGQSVRDEAYAMFDATAQLFGPAPPVAHAALPSFHRRRPPLPPSRPATTPGVVSLCFTQPQFLFPLRDLAELDKAAAAAVTDAGESSEGHETQPQHRSSLVPASALPPPHQPYMDDEDRHRQHQQQQQYQGTYPSLSRTSLQAHRVPLFPSSPPSSSNEGPRVYSAARPPRSPPQHRGDPKAPLLWCTFPLVLVLVVFDFVAIHSCRVHGWPVRFMQGLAPALGLLLLLYTLKGVVLLGFRSCMHCCTSAPIEVYTSARPAMQPRHGVPHARANYREEDAMAR